MERIERAIREGFDLRPAAFVRDLDLLRPIYRQTAAYGHFGRELPSVLWEGTERARNLKSAHRSLRPPDGPAVTGANQHTGGDEPQRAGRLAPPAAGSHDAPVAVLLRW
ncbi:methionine adenosyltransferase domain-containing protein [Micromonospora sp. WMMD1274]|uniref:methionine adenosyltransferase domain-containing protein n=1 Tax=Micromonospora TaxID=1873 RepID=UPI003BA3D90A